MDPWTDRLSDYLDDELELAERSALEQHLATCEACRDTLAALQRVIARASQLPPLVPTSDLWPGIEQRVCAIRPVRRTVTFSFGQLAAAAILLVAVSAGLAWVLLRGPSSTPSSTVPETASFSRPRPSTALPVSFADETYDRAVADLERALEDGRARLDPNTVRIIEKNLQTIDAAIAQAQRALEADPSNTYLNGHLASARQRKLALLRSVSRMTDPEG